jgi:hypothetical protein
MVYASSTLLRDLPISIPFETLFRVQAEQYILVACLTVGLYFTGPRLISHL